MAHRTHPTQQDEALRQAQATDELRTLTTALLAKIAGYLTRTRPTDTMINASRKYLAQSYATAHARWDTALADQIRAALLAAMPTPRTGQTRGEYAIIIRPARKADA
ncbi:hypothetical protein [Streptomyces sp. NPDC046332]|uniref:hypothetical protein n=1 Tax=unclassified Streptomyces TaxID=2593676 RepID=UPI0033E4D841